MSLYALGDLHLSFQADKSMDKFGRVWKNYERKIEKYVNKIVKPEDTLVLTGDHSWGRKLAECEEDLAFIEQLPGQKILLRGNHDMFWDAKKTNRLNEMYSGKLFFLQNNFVPYEDYALVGTKGYTFEGPFYLNRRGQIMGWDEEKEAHARKLVSREMERLRDSFRQAKAAGYRVYHVSSLSADKHPGKDVPVYGDCRRIRCGDSGIFSLPRREPLRGQYPGRVSRRQLYACVGGLSEFSAGVSVVMSIWVLL